MQHTEEYRTELIPFLLDGLRFIREMIEEAISEPDSQLVAVSDVTGFVGCIRKRLKENDRILTTFMLVFDEVSRRDWREWWGAFAKLERNDFLKRAAAMLEQIDALRTTLELISTENKRFGAE